ncbi:hypothetical protein Zmor_014302 [Zophobas morio]|uniref:DUF4780 domain-containing protein n=1 Tax=Zophobas morio TaxID=2755281 RepID=A0AA38IFR3_9CUCU|nr:hypothetical protein Zmor_014302 [Zophobas morio]
MTFHKSFCQWTNSRPYRVQASIVDKMVELEKGAEVKLFFLSTNHRLGWLSLISDDQTTAQWLRGRGGHIKPWDGASLKVMEVAEMSHIEILITIPGSQDYSNERILKLIEHSSLLFLLTPSQQKS